MASRRETRRLQRQLDAQLRRLTDQVERDLIRAWAMAWDETSTDLTALLVDLLTAGEQVTVAQLLMATRLRRALAEVADRLERLTAYAGVRVTQDLRRVVDMAGGAQASIIDSQLPSGSGLVDLESWARVDPRQVEAIVARSTQQITSRMRPVSASAYDVMRRELIRGVVSGSNPRVVARRMVARAREPFAGGLTRALTIARTEMLDAHRAGARAGQARHAEVLRGWMWLASLSTRTCPACLGMHGQVFDLDVPGPDGHQNCRCARMPVVRPWTELGFDGIEEPGPLAPDADGFFAGLTPREQQAILGPRGYQAWLAGRWPRSKWGVRRSNDGWRDSVVPGKPPRLPGGTAGRPPLPPARAPRGLDDDPAQRAADAIIARATNAEPAVTKLVQEVAATAGGRLERLEFRLKSRASIVDKLTRPGVDLAEAAEKIKDSLRYTIVIPRRKYARGGQSARDALAEAGYVLVKSPAGWPGAGYRGVNLAVRAPDGTVFEVQLHTAASLRAAEAAHLIYEEQRRLPVGSKRWLELEAEMAKIFNSVPWPPGLPRID
ncbi:phage minor head protein [Nocardioides soli]|uniref:SPP1 gp7 family putative phage head morphogenesis protein n=1 Tax=Nocardioides soli TaxID=1036020 RepID=A0A7W4VSZ0_9ACTN|nr:phage minor head protein [Nocardioides soli]MBB3041211.1 SPP1 gp7 family putative phage head morphogenesis protein [Nocardioides soli]